MLEYHKQVSNLFKNKILFSCLGFCAGLLHHKICTEWQKKNWAMRTENDVRG